MSKKDKMREDKVHLEELSETEVIRLDDPEDEDYYLDDEIDEEDEFEEDEEAFEENEDAFEADVEEYWLDDEEDEDSEDDFIDEKEEVDDEEIEPEEEIDSEEVEIMEDSDFDDEDDDESDEEDDEIPKKRNLKKVGIILGSIVGGLTLIYIGISVFFMSHFYINTEINGTKFSAKSASYVESHIKDQVKEYTLTILEKENKKDTITGADISLEYKESDKVKEALKKQNAFLWPKAFFVKSSTQVTIDVSYDKAALDGMISELKAVKAEQIPPTNAYPKYDGTQFVVEPEVTGTAVDMEVLNKKIHEYISGFKPELDMEEEKCYAFPKFTSDSKEVKDACDAMNQYLKASITYTMDEDVVVDKDLISTWLTVDDNMAVTFNEDGVREWLTAFGDRYDTMGGTRSITSPWGKTVEVSGGDYGWSIDEDTEFAALTESIKKGEVLTKEPAYYDGGIAASHGPQDWGSTYLEVDLSAQHMWFIVDGAVALETDVVTGVPIPARETTPGVWFVKEMQQNKTLVGEIQPETGKPEYETPVSYWMRITWSGIGFHDATWQPAFGGTLYADGLGSHGCINMPYDQAAALYNMLPMGTPAIVHY